MSSYKLYLFMFGIWLVACLVPIKIGCSQIYILQSHHTPGTRTGCSRAVLNNRTFPHGARTGPLRRNTNYWLHQIPCVSIGHHTAQLPVPHVTTRKHRRKFLRAFHSALPARNRAGAKNRMGPVVVCDWVSYLLEGKVTRCRHDMETFFAVQALCKRNLPGV